MQYTEIIARALDQRASDIHFTADRPPILRIDGRLEAMDADPLTQKDTERIARDIFSASDFERLTGTNEEVDASFSLADHGRFRINAYRQKGSVSMAIRCLRSTPPRLAELDLPPQLKEISLRHSGIILVTGPTGSGKSTSLAAMIREINETQNKHIITVEDPIEYLHQPDRSMVTQREIGRDTASFAAALRAALRQDPDVILVGEMRDLETIQTALTASETGHLVLSTLHTNGAVETINRIIDVFPTHQQAQIRIQLAANIQGIVSQQLLPLAQGPGRVAATELMIPTQAVRHMIREGKTHQIQSALTTGAQHGMHTMDGCLLTLYKKGTITREALFDYAVDPDNLTRTL